MEQARKTQWQILGTYCKSISVLITKHLDICVYNQFIKHDNGSDDYCIDSRNACCSSSAGLDNRCSMISGIRTGATATRIAPE